MQAPAPPPLSENVYRLSGIRHWCLDSGGASHCLRYTTGRRRENMKLSTADGRRPGRPYCCVIRPWRLCSRPRQFTQIGDATVVLLLLLLPSRSVLSPPPTASIAWASRLVSGRRLD